MNYYFNIDNKQYVMCYMSTHHKIIKLKLISAALPRRDDINR